MTSLLPPTFTPKPNPTLKLGGNWQVEFDQLSNVMHIDEMELGYDNVLKLMEFLEEHLIQMEAYYHEEQRTSCGVQLSIPGLEQLG